MTPTPHTGTLVLASSSPRRRSLLASLSTDVISRSPEIDETPLADETPEALVARLSIAKAGAVRSSGEVVLGSDTVVVLDGPDTTSILGKPTDPAHARKMLTSLSGRTHRILTGVAVLGPAEQRQVEIDQVSVTMRPLPAALIEWYLTTGEGHDKAGAYAIQGLAGSFVETIEGSPTAAIGLGLTTTSRLLTNAGIPLHGNLDPPPDGAHLPPGKTHLPSGGLDRPSGSSATD